MSAANSTAATIVFGEALVDDFATEQIVGGAPFNVARHLAAFMAPQLMITRVGADRNGATIQAEFERFAMSQAGLQRDPIEETGRVIVERGPQGHRFVIVPNQAYDYIARDDALAAAATVDAGAFYFGTLAQRGERSRATLKALLSNTQGKQLRFLDVNMRDGQVDERTVSDSLHAADIAKVNEDELQALFGWYFQLGPNDPPMAADETRSACGALLQIFGLQALIVTLAHRGSVYFGADGVTIDTRDTPAPPFVIDTVGAGDAFSAIFLLGRARGWPLDVTLTRANEFAGAICAIPGAVPRDLGFYDKWMTRWR